FEEVGATFSDEVPAFEKMKVGLLNGGHSAIAHLGLLRGHELAHDALADPLVRAWLEGYMREVAATLECPRGVDLAGYRRSLVARFSNAAIADRLARLAQDSSAKFLQALLPPLAIRLARGMSCDRL